MIESISQGVSQLTLKENLRKLRQPKYFYDELMPTNAENQAFVENIVNTILTKGYIPA